MARTLQDMLRTRPVDRVRVEQRKARMRDQLRAYRLRELREESELTQVALAELLHVSQNRVSRIERGELDRTQLDTLRRYIEALGGTLHLQAEFNGERVELV